MRKNIRAVCITTLSATMITTACAADFTAKDLADEEGKFAAYSVQHGMRAAFLEFFAAVDNGCRNHGPETPAEVVLVWRHWR